MPKFIHPASLLDEESDTCFQVDGNKAPSARGHYFHDVKSIPDGGRSMFIIGGTIVFNPNIYDVQKSELDEMPLDEVLKEGKLNISVSLKDDDARGCDEMDNLVWEAMKTHAPNAFKVTPSEDAPLPGDRAPLVAPENEKYGNRLMSVKIDQSTTVFHRDASGQNVLVRDPRDMKRGSVVEIVMFVTSYMLKQGRSGLKATAMQIKILSEPADPMVDITTGLPIIRAEDKVEPGDLIGDDTSDAPSDVDDMTGSSPKRAKKSDK